MRWLRWDAKAEQAAAGACVLYCAGSDGSTYQKSDREVTIKRNLSEILKT